jgi:WD40 repeat protein
MGMRLLAEVLADDTERAFAPGQEREFAGGLQHRGPIAGSATHGHWVATAGYDNRVILWDHRPRRAVARGQHDHLVNHCAFSADGRWLVSASSDFSARLWSVPEMRLQAVLTGHTDDVDMAVFSPDGTRIATCALDRCVRIFSRDGRCLREMRGHTGNVLSLAWSPDGRCVVTSSVDGSIRRWDTKTGNELERTELAVRTDSVEMAADGTVYAGDDYGRIAVITGGRPSFVTAHRAGVKKVALDMRRGLLVSLSYDRSMAVWRLGGPQLLQEISRSTLPDCVWARAAAVLDDGRIVAGTFGSGYAVFDPATALWDLEGITVGPALNAVAEIGGRIHTVGDAGRVCADGRPAAALGSLCNFLVEAGGRVFSGGQLGRLFDARSGAVLHTHHSPLICAAAFTRDGLPHVAVGTYTGEILLFAQRSAGSLRLVQTLAVYDNAVKGLSAGGGLLFSVCASTDIAWHRLDDGRLVRRTERAHGRIANACCDLGGSRFASVGRDRTLRLWDGMDPDAAEAYPSPHPNSVKCMAVDEARSTVLTGCYGGMLARFDLAARRWTDVLRPTDAGISAITWDRGRRRFLAASYDGGLYAMPAVAA